ncbi:MAG: isochorismate synthase [Cyanobacteria bacterium J06626_14]
MIVTPYREDPFLNFHYIHTFSEFFDLIQAELRDVYYSSSNSPHSSTLSSASGPVSKQFLSLAIPLMNVDPLVAVQTLASPQQVHFYWEDRKTGTAIAAIGWAERVCLSGQHRFAQAKQAIQDLFKRITPIGNVSGLCAEPRVFCQFTFFDSVAGESSISPATLVLPKWQIARHQSFGSFVANIPLTTPRLLKTSCIPIWETLMQLRTLNQGRGAIFKPWNHPLARQACPSLQWPRRRSASSVVSHSFRPLASKSVSRSPSKNNLLQHPALPTLPDKGKTEFKKNVASVLDAIAHTDLNKAVIAHVLDVDLDISLDIFSSLQSLRDYHSNCYLFSSQTEEGQTFLSASPERLLSIQSGYLTAEAIAGSAPRGYSPAEDAQLANTLLNNRKELHEHHLVASFICQQLMRLGMSPTRSVVPQILPLSTIQHLQTLLHAEVPDNLHPIDIVEALHPTPAVAGVPREMACELIQQYEPFERSLYAAPVGWIDRRGNSEFLVGIRSAMLNGRHARLYAGAGIVQGSNPQKELNEIELKLRSLYSALIHPNSST